MNLKIGIEQEFVFTDRAGRYLDADNSDYALFRDIVEALPAHPGDDRVLECKSLEAYPKRCYVEGFERHAADGTILETLPKGLEIRTLPHDSVDDLVREFSETYTAVMSLAANVGLAPALVSRHPFKNVIDLDNRVGAEESQVRTPRELALAKRAMLTHGMHVTVSLARASIAQMSDLREKVLFYLPALIPWSFSSPFRDGAAFEGLCARNHLRADSRSMADVRERQGVQLLEFRGFDALGNSGLMRAVLRMYRGFLLDRTLNGRSTRQDPDQIRNASIRGFGDPALRDTGRQMLDAARPAFEDSPEAFRLLEQMLETNDSEAARMKRRHAGGESIIDCFTGRYDF